MISYVPPSFNSGGKNQTDKLRVGTDALVPYTFDIQSLNLLINLHEIFAKSTYFYYLKLKFGLRVHIFGEKWCTASGGLRPQTPCLGVN